MTVRTDKARTIEPRTIEPGTIEPATDKPVTMELVTVQPTMLELTTIEPAAIDPTTLVRRAIRPEDANPRRASSEGTHADNVDATEGPRTTSEALGLPELTQNQHGHAKLLNDPAPLSSLLHVPVLTKDDASSS